MEHMMSWWQNFESFLNNDRKLSQGALIACLYGAYFVLPNESMTKCYRFEEALFEFMQQQPWKALLDELDHHDLKEDLNVDTIDRLMSCLREFRNQLDK